MDKRIDQEIEERRNNALQVILTNRFAKEIITSQPQQVISVLKGQTENAGRIVDQSMSISLETRFEGVIRTPNQCVHSSASKETVRRLLEPIIGA